MRGKGRRRQRQYYNSLINIVKNPIIIGIVLGVAASLLKIDFPEIIDKTLASLAKMASPLALITIGAGFEGRKANSENQADNSGNYD